MAAPNIPQPNAADALKKLWDITQQPGVFSLYDKEIYRHDSDTDTASETEEECPLPVVFPSIYRPENENLTKIQLLEKGRIIYKHVLIPDTKESYGKVEQVTKLQSHTPTWEIFRAGRITGTKVHDIRTRKDTTAPDKLVRKIMGYGEHFTSDQTQWGLDKEEEALSVYIKTIEPYHNDVALRKSGFLICPKYPYLGVSPDGIRSCACHDDILVEVKCPYTAKDQNPRDKFGNSSFCIDGTGELKKNHRYYTQIQLQLYISQMHFCDLVIYTGVADYIYITQVEIDEQFCNEMVAKSTLFFFNEVMPELLARKIEKDLPTPTIEGNGICFCGKPPKGRVIICAEKNCCTKQFHYTCVGIRCKPKGTNWYCPVCVRMSSITDTD